MNTWMIWEKFNETSLSDNEYFFSHLNITKQTEDITDADYMYAERDWKDF